MHCAINLIVIGIIVLVGPAWLENPGKLHDDYLDVEDRDYDEEFEIYGDNDHDYLDVRRVIIKQLLPGLSLAAPDDASLPSLHHLRNITVGVMKRMKLRRRKLKNKKRPVLGDALVKNHTYTNGSTEATLLLVADVPGKLVSEPVAAVTAVTPSLADAVLAAWKDHGEFVFAGRSHLGDNLASEMPSSEAPQLLPTTTTTFSPPASTSHGVPARLLEASPMPSRLPSTASTAAAGFAPETTEKPSKSVPVDS